MEAEKSLTAEELEKSLKPKEIKFVKEYIFSGNGTEAAIAAGYTPGKNNQSAANAASRLLRRAEIKEYRQALAREMAEYITPEIILEQIDDIRGRCMQAKPVMEWDKADKKWVPTGEYTFDSRGALKALELIGSAIGMYKGGIGSGDNELKVNIEVTGAEKKVEG